MPLDFRRPPVWALGAFLLLVMVSVPGAARAARSLLCAGRSEWVGAWMTAMETSSSDLPALVEVGAGASFPDQTLRMIVTPTVAGDRVRLVLSNRFGDSPVELGATRVAKSGVGAAVDPVTDRAATFGGSRSVTVDAGKSVRSDPIALPVGAFEEIAVSIHVKSDGGLDLHRDARAQQYLAPGSGDRTSDGGSAFTVGMRSWLALTAVEVRPAEPGAVVVALGDSLTDGFGSSIDEQARWTDQLARRIDEDPPTAVINAGIDGNRLLPEGEGTSAAGAGFKQGPSAMDRFEADVLDRTGVTHVVLWVGINDLFGAANAPPVHDMIAGYRHLASLARAAGLQVLVATLGPASLRGEAEAARQSINDWIRSSTAINGVVDVDRAVRDPGDPRRVAPLLASDVVHLNDRGYAMVAEAVDPESIGVEPPFSFCRRD